MGSSFQRLVEVHVFEPYLFCVSWGVRLGPLPNLWTGPRIPHPKGLSWWVMAAVKEVSGLNYS